MSDNRKDKIQRSIHVDIKTNEEILKHREFLQRQECDIVAYQTAVKDLIEAGLKWYQKLEDRK